MAKMIQSKIQATKVCAKCKKEKAADSENFNKKSAAKDGLKSYCVPCDTEVSAEYYEQNKEKRIAQVRRWQARHSKVKVNL